MQALFNGLPERIQDRKSSTSDGPKSQAKKRPPPQATASEIAHGQGKLTPSNNSPSGEKPLEAQRSSTFPSGRPNKAPGQESSPFRATQTWNAGTTSGIPTPDSIQPFTEQMQTSPSLSNFDTQFGNPNLPDLKNVMFPSDNPFAYPNQPISTLESSQFTSGAQTNSPLFFSANTVPNATFDGMPGPMYNGLEPFQQNRQMTQSGLNNNNNNPTFVDAPMDLPMTGVQQVDGSFPPVQDGGYWNQLGGNRTGLTPGVNLEDLFGSDQYSSVWDGSGYGMQ